MTRLKAIEKITYQNHKTIISLSRYLVMSYKEFFKSIRTWYNLLAMHLKYMARNDDYDENNDICILLRKFRDSC